VFSSFLLATVLPVEFCWSAAIFLSVTFEGALSSGIKDWVFARDVIERAKQV
jgi:hypothetical protein